MSEGSRGARAHAARLWPWLLIVLAAAVWWAGVWNAADGSVLTRVPILDESFYLREGEAIASGRLLPDRPFIMSPAYPYLVAATGSGRTIEDGVRRGSPPRGIRILQAALWLGTAALLWRIGRRMMPGRVAWIPPLLFLLYRPAAVFATTTLLEIPLAFSALLSLGLLAGPSGRRAGPSRIVAAGLLIGLATLLRGTSLALLLPAALMVALPVGSGGDDPGARRDRLRRLALLAGAAAAVLLPVVAFNSARSGRPAGISCNGGLNLYIGNGPEAAGYYVQFAGFDFERDPAGVDYLSRKMQRDVSGPAEADRLWAGAAWQSIRERPLRAAGLWLRKIRLHLVAWEIAQITPLDAWPREAPWLRPLAVPYGALTAGGLLGLFLCGWRDRRWRPWALALAVLIAGQSVFFVVSRYRLVLVPLLCLLSGGAVAELLRLRGRRLWAGLTVLVAAVLLVQPWGLDAVRTQWLALGRCNEAVRWEWLGTPEARAEAERLYRDAREIDSSQIQVHRGLARVLVNQERAGEAEAALSDGILRVADPSPLQQDLISLLLSADRVTAAIPRLAAYLRDHPDDPEMLHNYVVALSRSGRHRAALDPARRLMEVAPDSARSYLDLGVLLARLRRDDEARRVFAAGVERFPADEALRVNLQRLEARPR